jgi:hypothetical protein
MNPGFITGIYSWQKSISVFLTALEKFCTDVFSGCFVFDGEQFRHPPWADFSVAKFSDDGRNFRFHNPYCDVQLTSRDAEVIPNQRINALFCLLRRCRGWSATTGLVTSAPFTALKTMDPACNWANIYDITIHASHTSMNPYRTGGFRSKKFNHHSLPSMYVHNIRHFALLLCVTHVTDWIIDDPGGAGQCRYPVGEERNSTRRHI